MKSWLHPALPVLLVLALSAGACAVAPATAPLPEEPALQAVLDAGRDPVPFTDHVRKGTLDNGLTWMVRANPFPAGRIQLFLAVKTGSMDEEDGEEGLAHFLEHMAFNGTASFPRNEMVSWLQSIGMQFGPEVNAYTSFQRTVYSIEIPADNPGALEKGLTILDDWARHISLNADDVADERGIIHEEWRMNLGAEDRMQRVWLPVVLRGSRYPDRWPIGKPGVFDNAAAPDLERFYHETYRPERMGVIVVGDLDPDLVGKMIQTRFGGAYPAATPRSPADTSVPAPEKGRFSFATFRDPGLTESRMQLLWRLSAESSDPRRAYRESILWGIAGDVVDARLQDRQSDPSCPWVGAGAGMGRYMGDARFLIFTVVPKTGREKEALEALMAVRADLMVSGIRKDEWDRAERSLALAFRNMADQPGETPSRTLAEELVRHFTEDETVPGIAWEADEVDRIVALAEPGAGDALLARAWKTGDLTFLSSGPDSRPDPFGDAAAARSVLDDMDARTMQQAREALLASPAPGAPVTDTMELPVPGADESGSIVSRIEDKELGTMTWVLSNGMRILVRPTDLRNDEVAFNGVAPGGFALASLEDLASAREAGGMASFSGLGDMDRVTLSRFMKEHTTSLEFGLADTAATMGGTSTRKDMDFLFRLLRLHFTALRLDPEPARAFLEGEKTRLEGIRNDPQQTFFRTVDRLLEGDGPRARPVEPGDLDHVDIDRARAFLSRIARPGDWTIAFAGSMDLKELEGLVVRYLAGIPAGPAVASVAWEPVNRPRGLDVTVALGSDPKGITWLSWHRDHAYSYGELVQARVFNELLDIMLLNRVREAMGAAYTIGASCGFQSLPAQELVLGIYYACDPSRETEVRKAVLDILDALAAGRIDPADLEKARKIVGEKFRSEMANNTSWASVLAQLSAIRKVDPAVVQECDSFLAGIQTADMAALAALFDRQNLNAFRLAPEGDGGN